MQTAEFQNLVWDHYREHGRHELPWRVDTSPYSVFISEVMLQQTQVGRVIPKYQEFLAELPDFNALVRTDLATVLRLWSGLGYNRRAQYLHRAGRLVGSEFDGQLPREIDQLQTLPGVGYNTAAAIACYAFNRPAVFIETNIRSAFLHHFFLQGPTLQNGLKVDNTELLPLIGQTLDWEHPREWYWALMDYGADLKRRQPNPSRASRHYTKQSRFAGSTRQLRGQVIKQLLDAPQTQDQLAQAINDERLPAVLDQLQTEGMVVVYDATYRLP